jgi:hypothetical protein
LEIPVAKSFPASRGGKSSAMAKAKSLGLAFSATPIDVKAWDDSDPSAPLIGRRLMPALAPQAILEPLEARELMSVTLNSAGFTVVTPAADSRIVYVSNSLGDDDNSGLSEGAPVKTLAKAITLIRNNSADQMLLKRGDTWKESFGYWKKSGRSADNPIVISAYGVGDRPLISTGDETAMTIGSVSAKNIKNLDIIGLHFYADGRDPHHVGFNKDSQAYAIQCVAGGSGLLIEDVQANEYFTNMSFVPYYGQMHDVTIRRSILTDSYGTSAVRSHSEGIFVDGVQGLRLEQNTFDHNGWAEGVTGAEPTQWNHNAYLTAATSGVVVTGNVFANASSHGLQARSGGVIVGNLFLNNAIGMSYGLVNGAGCVTHGGVHGEVSDNVFIGGRDINGSRRGIGIEIANIAPNSGTVIQRNIFSQYTGGVLPAIMLTSGVGDNQADAQGMHDLTLRDNIVYKWTQGLSVQSGMSPDSAKVYKQLTNVVLRGNNFVDITSGKTLINAGNLDVDRRAGSDARSINGAPLPDPDVTVADYAASIGGVHANWQFTADARTLSADNWNTSFTATPVVNFIRAGFGLPAIAGTTAPGGGGSNGGGDNTGGGSNNNGGSNSGGSNSGGGTDVTPTNPSDDSNNSGKSDNGKNDNGNNNNGGTPNVGKTPGVHGTPHVRRRDAAVYVRALSLSKKHHQIRITVRFSRDVGSTIDLNDLNLTGPNGQAINVSNGTFSYNAKKHRAQWILDKDASTAQTQKGRYIASLSSTGIADGNNRHLDGNKDRVGGDDFLKALKIRK